MGCRDTFCNHDKKKKPPPFLIMLALDASILLGRAMSAAAKKDGRVGPGHDEKRIMSSGTHSPLECHAAVADGGHRLDLANRCRWR